MPVDRTDRHSGRSNRGSSVKRCEKRSRKRRLVLRLLVATAAILLSAILCAAWLVHRAQQIEAGLKVSFESVAEIRDAIDSSDGAQVEVSFKRLQTSSDKAHEAATDPVWRAASAVPLFGANFHAVSEMAVSLNDVVNRAAAPLVGDLDYLKGESLVPIEGRIDLTPIEEAAPKLSAAATTIRLSHERLATLDQTLLLPQVADPLRKATDALAGLSSAFNGASAAADLMPEMLGSDRQRNYLLLIQNNAEVRATGGIPGALAVISAQDGQLQMTAQSSASSMRSFDPAIITDPEQEPIYSARMGTYMQSINLTPDFPTVARTGAAMWEARDGNVSIDGVIALDPIALSYILEATGPIELTFQDDSIGHEFSSEGLPRSLTSENVVSTLLSQVYSAIDEPELQDAYFAEVASKVFERLASGSGDGSNLVQSLVKSSEERRLLVWSAHTEEQGRIASTGISGDVTGTVAGGAAFGAYFNDGTGAKMDYYVRRTVQLNRSCDADGYIRYTLTASLTNTAPADAPTSLPSYVTGGGNSGVPAGSVQTNVVSYGPDRSQLHTARLDGGAVPLGSYRHGERPVGVLTVSLAPGQTATVEFDFTNVVQQSDPVLHVTPTVQPLSEVVLPLAGEKTCA